jgi:GNAT superfamily N-acetyltransferase
MLEIRRLKKSDIIAVCNLIIETYKKYNHKKSSPKMLKSYLDTYSPKSNDLEKLFAYFKKSPIQYVALNKQKIIGVVRGRPERLVNLYINGQYHHQGIGGQLISIFEKEAQKRGGKIIKIRSSIFAVPFYQKQGYKKTTGTRKIKDLVFQPMQKIIK